MFDVHRVLFEQDGDMRAVLRPVHGAEDFRIQ
jgi:hypothetical protein